MPTGAVRALFDRGVDGHPVIFVQFGGFRGDGGESEWCHVQDAAAHELAGDLEFVGAERGRFADETGDADTVTDVGLRIVVDVFEPGAEFVVAYGDGSTGVIQSVQMPCAVRRVHVAGNGDGPSACVDVETGAAARLLERYGD